MKRISTSLLFLLLHVAFTLNQTNAEEPVKQTKSEAISRKDLVPSLDGKEVTMILKITDTQAVGGDREGQFPHVKLHHEPLSEPPYLLVYAKGDLADALHRFACLTPDSRLNGRSIRATGKLRVEIGADKVATYVLDIRDWKKFQILPEPK